MRDFSVSVHSVFVLHFEELLFSATFRCSKRNQIGVYFYKSSEKNTSKSVWSVPREKSGSNDFPVKIILILILFGKAWKFHNLPERLPFFFKFLSKLFKKVLRTVKVGLLSKTVFKIISPGKITPIRNNFSKKHDFIKHFSLPQHKLFRMREHKTFFSFFWKEIFYVLKHSFKNDP